MFQAHRADGHHGSLPTRLDRADRWPLLFAAVVRWLASRSARGRARADAQGRCDGAGSEEIGCKSPPTFLIGRGRAFGHSVWEEKQRSPISLVKLPGGGLGPQNATPLPGATFWYSCAGIPRLPT